MTLDGLAGIELRARFFAARLSRSGPLGFGSVGVETRGFSVWGLGPVDQAGAGHRAMSIDMILRFVYCRPAQWIMSNVTRLVRTISNE